MDTDAPDFSLDGRTALVTGAARGLGRAIALALAHAGADVALGLRDAASGRGLAREIEALGRRAVALQMDLADIAQAAGGSSTSARRRAPWRFPASPSTA